MYILASQWKAILLFILQAKKISEMWLAKTSSIAAKFEILPCKNYSFHGNLNDRNNMAERFPKCDGKKLQELKEITNNANNKEGTKAWVTAWSI